jgi:hypothetical protein
MEIFSFKNRCTLIATTKPVKYSGFLCLTRTPGRVLLLPVYLFPVAIPTVLLHSLTSQRRINLGIPIGVTVIVFPNTIEAQNSKIIVIEYVTALSFLIFDWFLNNQTEHTNLSYHPFAYVIVVSV